MKNGRKQRSPVTKTGDAGETGLLYGGRVSKNDARVEAYGTVDEAVSALGLARALSNKKISKQITLSVQKNLFTVSAELATDPSFIQKFKEHFKPVTVDMVDEIDGFIKKLEAEIDIPRTFIIPGATPAAAAFDLARTITRRAERRAVDLKQKGLLGNTEIIRYLNRLSDLLYELARYETKDIAQEVPVSGRKK